MWQEQLNFLRIAGRRNVLVPRGPDQLRKIFTNYLLCEIIGSAFAELDGLCVGPSLVSRFQHCALTKMNAGVSTGKFHRVLSH